MTDDFTKFELKRFNEWLHDENRKPAHLAFTAGPLRQVADLVERSCLGAPLVWSKEPPRTPGRYLYRKTIHDDGELYRVERKLVQGEQKLVVDGDWFYEVTGFHGWWAGPIPLPVEPDA